MLLVHTRNLEESLGGLLDAGDGGVLLASDLDKSSGAADELLQDDCSFLTSLDCELNLWDNVLEGFLLDASEGVGVLLGLGVFLKKIFMLFDSFLAGLYVDS